MNKKKSFLGLLIAITFVAIMAFGLCSSTTKMAYAETTSWVIDSGDGYQEYFGNEYSVDVETEREFLLKLNYPRCESSYSTQDLPLWITGAPDGIGYTFSGTVPSTAEDCSFIVSCVDHIEQETVFMTINITVSQSDKFLVTYDLNGGVGTAPNSVFASKGESIIISAGTGITKTNYTFAGWRKIDSSTESCVFCAGESLEVTGDITLYAEWNIILNQPTIDNDYEPSVLSLETLSFEWYEKGETDTLISSNSKLTEEIDGENTYYCLVSYIYEVAGYEFVKSVKTNEIQSHAVSFNANGGTGESLTIYNLDGRNIILPSSPFVYSGYIFSGWATLQTAQSKEFNVGANYKINGENKVLYAVWIKNRVAITINELSQNYVFGTDCSFLVKGTDIDKSTFAVSYFYDDDWKNVVPTKAGKYNVKIERNEDECYEEFSRIIENGFVIGYKIRYIDELGNGVVPVDDKLYVPENIGGGVNVTLKTADDFHNAGSERLGYNCLRLKNDKNYFDFGDEIVIFDNEEFELVWELEIKQQPQASNDFEVIIDAVDAEFAWCEHLLMEYEVNADDDLCMLDGFGKYILQNNSFISEELESAYEVGLYLKFDSSRVSAGDLFCYTLTKNGVVMQDEDGECFKTIVWLNDKLIVKIESSEDELNIGKNFIISNCKVVKTIDSIIDGETCSKIKRQTAAKDYLCKITYEAANGEFVTILSNIISKNIINLNENGGEKITDLKVSNFEGRKVVLLENTYLKTNCRFVCWNTKADGSGTSYNVTDEIVVGNTDIELYAIWFEKQIIMIDENKQAYFITDNDICFKINSQLSGFVIKYFVDGDWISEIPNKAGEYNVSIFREADEDYLEFSKVIENGLIITAVEEPDVDKNVVEENNDIVFWICVISIGVCAFGGFMFVFYKKRFKKK